MEISPGRMLIADAWKVRVRAMRCVFFFTSCVYKIHTWWLRCVVLVL